MARRFLLDRGKIACLADLQDADHAHHHVRRAGIKVDAFFGQRHLVGLVDLAF